nr:serine protease [Planctomycetota bacterium]
ATANATAATAGPRSAAELLAQLGPAVVTVSVTTDAGTNPVGVGIILFGPQYIVTPYHLVKGTKQVLVDYFRNSTSGEHSHQSATVIAVDREHDLALLSSSNPYHAKPLVLGNAASAGTEVVAIINPKLTSAAGPQTTLAGSIGASAQKADAALVIQTSLAVPASNQGSPVLAMDGTVVGLVTGRLSATEPGGMAVPALFADRLYQGHDDKFATGADFPLWEMELPFTDLKNASGAVRISGLASHMVYDAEHGQLVMLIPARNKVLFLTIKDNVVAKELFTGTDPVDLKMSLTSKNLAWVANNTSKNIVSINLTTRAVEKTLTLTNAPLAMTLVRDSIWFMNATGTACVVKYSGGEDQEAPLSIRSLAYNGQRNNILMGSRNSWLCEVDGDHIQSLIQRQRTLRAEIDDYNKNAKFASKTSADARYDELTAEMRTLEAAIAKCDKVYNQPAGVATDFTTTQQSLFIDQPRGRVYFNRAVMDSKAPDKIIGVFKSPEHSLRNSEHLRELFAKYTYVNQIIAVSPDGGVAASGTHLFNTEDFTVLRELPVPTTAIAFAPDMRTLWFCDVVNNQIVSMRYRDDSWTPPVVDPKKAK